MKGTLQQKQHMSEVMAQVDNQLNSLIMTYDTKVLATAMMIKAARLLRGLHSTNNWRVEDVEAVIEGALTDVYEQLPDDEMPKVATTAMTSHRPS